MSPASRESSRIALVLVAALSSASCSSRLVTCAFTLSLLSFSCWQLALSSAFSFSDLQFRKLGECWNLKEFHTGIYDYTDSESRNLGFAESGSRPRFFNPHKKLPNLVIKIQHSWRKKIAILFLITLEAAQCKLQESQPSRELFKAYKFSRFADPILLVHGS